MLRIRQEDTEGRFRGSVSVHLTWRAASAHYLSREQCVIHTAEASLNSLQWRGVGWGWMEDISAKRKRGSGGEADSYDLMP